MRNIAFTIWMVGFSFAMILNNYLTEYLLHKHDGLVILDYIIDDAIWIIIGVLLYEKAPKKKE